VIRLIVRTIVALAANAVGLIVAAAVLDDMELDVGGFVLALVIFTIAFALLQPFLVVQLRGAGSAALGGVALLATLASLIITDLLSDGFTIDGGVTWLLAAVIVWAAAVIATFILPFLGLKRFLEERRD
jgi:putative membrane protein